MYKKLSHLQVKHSEQRKLGVCLKTTATDVAENETDLEVFHFISSRLVRSMFHPHLDVEEHGQTNRL